MEKEPSEVLDDALAEVKRRNPRSKRTFVILVAGQEEQLQQVEEALKRHGMSAIVIQDFYHVTEYVWSAAWCLFSEGEAAAETWIDEQLVNILKGRAVDVAAQMRATATRRKLTQSEREPLDRCANYLQKNQERLDYAQALELGAPIGTGVIEGACRHLVKTRMECSGARWSLEGAEAVLRLRALYMSGDWDAYCEFHESQERLRNYPEAFCEPRLAA